MGVESKKVDGDANLIGRLAAIYPDNTNLFRVRSRPIDDITRDCLFVLDTTTLLVPYTASKESFDEIKRVYSQLCQEKRLLVPTHSAREFADNRPNKIKELYSQLSRLKSSKQKSLSNNYPLLSDDDAYQKLKEIDRSISAKLVERDDLLDALSNRVENWQWDDPVSLAYAKLFGDGQIVSLEMDKEEFGEDMEKRTTFKIPPGYKDAAKPTNSEGDLIIWQTVLQIARQRQQHIILVSSDNKSDWWIRSENKLLYPRFELVYEYYAASQGKTFHIVSLSKLLKMFGAGDNVISNVNTVETSPGLKLWEDRLRQKNLSSNEPIDLTVRVSPAMPTDNVFQSLLYTSLEKHVEAALELKSGVDLLRLEATDIFLLGDHFQVSLYISGDKAEARPAIYQAVEDSFHNHNSAAKVRITDADVDMFPTNEEGTSFMHKEGIKKLLKLYENGL